MKRVEFYIGEVLGFVTFVVLVRAGALPLRGWGRA